MDKSQLLLILFTTISCIVGFFAGKDRGKMDDGSWLKIFKSQTMEISNNLILLPRDMMADGNIFDYFTVMVIEKYRFVKVGYITRSSIGEWHFAEFNISDKDDLRWKFGAPSLKELIETIDINRVKNVHCNPFLSEHPHINKEWDSCKIID